MLGRCRARRPLSRPPCGASDAVAAVWRREKRERRRPQTAAPAGNATSTPRPPRFPPFCSAFSSDVAPFTPPAAVTRAGFAVDADGLLPTTVALKTPTPDIV